ncbi:MAG TPA: proline--tRNA ligase, partial [Quisquiliibacterium sp.]|nr:proline--tRNA ligase [Quisquiliibacterium sp.]
QEIRSYRQMPKNFYHIQTKFRDERRPRFGVMRGREFTMKDAYSFDRDRESALRSYQAMFDAYVRIFDRMGLTYRAVAADTGAIGGSASHEFQVIADTGEDAIAYCPDSDFAANVELAEALALGDRRDPPAEAMWAVPTPGMGKCEQVAALLGVPLQRTVKSLVVAVDRREPVKDGAQDVAAAPRIVATDVCLLLVRGDHELNEVKAGKVEGLKGFRFATDSEIVEHFGCEPGYLGPLGTAKPVRVIADRTVALMSDFVCGANQVDTHLAGVNWGRDLPEPEVADLRNVVEGDPSPDGKGRLAIQRGIEVGHVFYLGTKYSSALEATFIDADGKSKVIEMGCYGIGVTRLLGAAIEQNHDERGIIWPRPIAPFEVVICPLGLGKSDQVRTVAEQLYADLSAAGVDVLLDDRDERPGVMFADWELIGVPVRVTIGERALKEGKVELLMRRGLQGSAVPVADAAAAVRDLLARC